MKLLYFLPLALFALVLLFGCTGQTGQVACTMEAKVCPDGSTVGRTGPNCEFTPCLDTNCTCPTGYRQSGDTCTPECYYSTPNCLAPSIKCGPQTLPPSTVPPIGGTQGAQIANPASVNCIDNNGMLAIVDTNEGQVGMCTLPSGKVCEEWAYFRGTCKE